MASEPISPDYAGRSCDDNLVIDTIEIRSRSTNSDREFARVTLDHPVRGRVTDVAFGRDALDAMFRAIGNALHSDATICSMSLRYTNFDPSAECGVYRVDLELERSGERVQTSASSHDGLRACAKAYLAGLIGEPNPVMNCATTDAQEFTVQGMDENGDLWTFSSADAGAVEAVAGEFRDDAFRWVKLS